MQDEAIIIAKLFVHVYLSLGVCILIYVEIVCAW